MNAKLSPHAIRFAVVALLAACDAAATPAHDASTVRDAAALDASDAARDAAAEPELYALELPPGFPVPVVPALSPVTSDRVELGRHLFYDKRLSGNGTQSCGSCHQQALAFTDGRPVGVGSTGESHVRGSMSLANVAYASAFTWANPTIHSLELQMLVPLFGTTPVELGLTQDSEQTLAALRDDDHYRALFATSFPGVDEPITLTTVLAAIAAFERALISGDSPYDHYLQGDASALSEAAERGRRLFFSDMLECSSCHAGFNLSGDVTYEGQAFEPPELHNTGLYNLDGEGAYPPDNTGLYAFTQRPEDMGRFKAPTLRNIAVTAPYMHDGSIATLPEVIEHYARGGRLIESGPLAGDGRLSPWKSERVGGFFLTASQKADLLAFLESLTDESFLHDPRFSDPYASDAGTGE